MIFPNWRWSLINMKHTFQERILIFENVCSISEVVFKKCFLAHGFALNTFFDLTVQWYLQTVFLLDNWIFLKFELGCCNKKNIRKMCGYIFFLFRRMYCNKNGFQSVFLKSCDDIQIPKRFIISMLCLCLFLRPQNYAECEIYNSSSY